MLRLDIIIILLLVTLSTTRAQTYDRYFANKLKADSLVARGSYIDAIPFLKVCVSEPAMVTVHDEFSFGYALFKNNKIDSAAVFLHRALNNGFHFQDMGQVKYWSDAGVFERFMKHGAMKGLAEKLDANTQAFVNSRIDSVLLKQLLEAREKDQRFGRQKSSDEENQQFLKQVIGKYGWPTHDLVGWHGSNAAFLIAQHADKDPQFQNECMGYIRDAYYRQKIDPSSYAYIIDRTRVNAGRPQVFGTQFDKPIESRVNVNLRRKVLGLGTLEKYLSDNGR